MEERLTGSSTVIGVFDDTYQAERALAELGQLGFSRDQVEFAMSEASTIAGDYSIGEEPVFVGQEAGRAVLTVSAGDRNQEVMDLLHRYGAIDVRIEDDPTLTSRGNVRDYGNSGDRTVRSGSTGSAYDQDRGDRPIDDSTPERITDANTYNVDIEGTGEVKTGASGGAPAPAGGPSQYGTWEQARPYYRSRWESHYGTAGRRWEDYEPAYRHGWESARSSDYQRRSWSEAEPRLRSDWEQGHNLSPWERIADAVRDAWDSVTGHHDRSDMDRAA